MTPVATHWIDRDDVEHSADVTEEFFELSASSRLLTPGWELVSMGDRKLYRRNKQDA